MNSTRLLAFVLAGSVLVPQLVRAQEPATRPAEPVAVQQPRPVDALVQRVREAQDPSSAIQAYADARALAPNDLEVQKAFVHRMVELGLPEMANQQAQDVLTRAPNDGVAWAVSGYLAAKRNQMGSAATDLASASQLAPDDPFVQRTGAQIVAWADSHKDKTDVSPQALVAIGTIRDKLSGRPEYAQAYQGALTAYQQMAMAPAPTAQGVASAASQPGTEASGYDALLGPSSYYPSPAAYPEPAYQTPYYYAPAYYGQPYWYPSGYYGSYWWWPTASCFVIVDDDFHHHHDFDNFHHNHGFDNFHQQHGDAEFHDPHFFDHRGHFGDSIDPQRHFAFSPLNHGSIMTASPNTTGRAFANGVSGGSFSGIRTSPSLAPNRVVSPAGSSAAPSRAFSPILSSPAPGRASIPAMPSGHPISGGGAVAMPSAPRMVFPAAPGMPASPGGRGGWPSAAEAPHMHGGGPVGSHAQPAGAAMSPAGHSSGGASSGHEMSGGGGLRGGGGFHR